MNPDVHLDLDSEHTTSFRGGAKPALVLVLELELQLVLGYFAHRKAPLFRTTIGPDCRVLGGAVSYERGNMILLYSHRMWYRNGRDARPTLLEARNVWGVPSSFRGLALSQRDRAHHSDEPEFTFGPHLVPIRQLLE